MSRSVHNLLNKVIPRSGKEALRGAALQVIPTMRHLDMPTRLKHLASIGFAPGVIYDVGAARGEWTRLAHAVFPGARIFGFEPNAREKPSLENTKRDLSCFDYRICFLGPRRETVRYSDENTQTSLLSQTRERGHATAEMYVLDELIAAGELPPPDFIKLDVQGFELEVLRGAEKALLAGPALLLEVSFIEFLPKMPLIEDVMKFMSEREYVWHDAMGLSRRAEDDTLWQMDVFFLKRDHPMRR
jgi:FkbM family methyltransferase